MQKTAEASRVGSAKTAEMVKLISEIGPDIPEISRRFGQFKESVRYRYKEKVLGRGFGVQAAIDHGKLGLRRVLFVVDFGTEFKQYASAILSAMNELSYVVYFEKRMLYDDYLVTASAPSEFVEEYVGFLFKLKERGLFASLEVVPFEWFRMNPMKADFYDFDTGRWDFDWSVPIKDAGEAAYSPPSQVKIDYLDLLILKELQMDATRNFVEIADKIKVNYKVLAWHLKAHVIERKMISGYYLRWMGTSYDTKQERALHRQHRYQHMCVLATDLLLNERMEIMAKMHGVPFLWSEMVGDRQYFAEFYFPTEETISTFQFLTRSVSSKKDKVSVMVLDQSEALSFTLSYQLFDRGRRTWTFDEQCLLGRFEKLSAQIRETGGS